jgi:hypothetical protein
MSDFQSPGEYDREVSDLAARLQAAGIILIVMGGNRGDGVACRLSREALADTPHVLRSIMAQIEGIEEGRDEPGEHVIELTEDDVPEDFKRDFRAVLNEKSTTPVAMTRYAMWCLMCAVQLATRHPAAANSPPLMNAARIARTLQKVLSTTPALARVAEMGWDLSDADEHGLDG